MARKRLIDPQFFTHPGLYDAEAATGLPLRIAFAGLWCQADRAGRFRWEPRVLKLHILPFDATDFGTVLTALEQAGYVQKYTVDGRDYGCIPSFGKWQTFHRTERESTLPAPPERAGEVANTRVLTVNAPLDTREATDTYTAVTVAVTGAGTGSVAGTAGTAISPSAAAEAPSEDVPRLTLCPPDAPQSRKKGARRAKVGARVPEGAPPPSDAADAAAPNDSAAPKKRAGATWLGAIRRAHEDRNGPGSFTPALAAQFIRSWGGIVAAVGEEAAARTWHHAQRPTNPELRFVTPERVAARYAHYDPDRLVAV